MYSRHITRREKGAVVFLIDQSGSMAEEINFQGESTSKARALASIANSLIEEFICRSQRERGVGDYFDIAVIGYGGEKATSLATKRLKIFYKPKSLPLLWLIVKTCYLPTLLG